jgi:hypothetical protein
MESTTPPTNTPQPDPPSGWYSWLFRWPAQLLGWFNQPRERPKKRQPPRNRLGIQFLEDRFSPSNLFGL